MQGAGVCVGRPRCADLQPLLAVSVWRPVQRELLQTTLPHSRLLLVLSSDTAPTTAHNCPPELPSSCLLLLRHLLRLLPKSPRPWELVPPRLEVEIDQLLFQRDEKQRHVLCGWGGNGTLPCLFGQSYSLFIQTRTPDSPQSR